MSDEGPGGDLAALYALPADEFVAARNALAARLRKEGRRDQAEQVKKLPRPTQAVWAINALTRHHPELVEDLFAAGSQLREAQAAALEGRVGAAALRESTEVERAVLARLVGAAQALLVTSGAAPTAATVERIQATLQALGRDPEGPARLGKGHLAEELGADGFDLLAGLAGLPPAPKESPKPAPPPVAAPVAAAPAPVAAPQPVAAPVSPPASATVPGPGGAGGAAYRRMAESASQAAAAAREVATLSRQQAERLGALAAEAEAASTLARQAAAEAEGRFQKARLEASEAADEARAAEDEAARAEQAAQAAETRARKAEGR